MAMENNVADVAERIAHFREITGVTDPEQCSQILEAHGWDLDQAVNTVLAVSDGDVYDRRGADETEQLLGVDGLGGSRIRGSAPPGQDLFVDGGGNVWAGRGETANGTAILNGYAGGGLYERRNGGRGAGGGGVGGTSAEAGPGAATGSGSLAASSSASAASGGLVWRLLTLPGAVVWGGLGLVTGVVGLGFRFARGGLSLGMSTLGSLAGMIGVGSAGGYDRVPSQDVSEGQRFLQRFEAEYGVVHPAFLIRTFMDAVRMAAAEFKFLFVYLHSSEHVSTPGFCREVLCDPSVVEFLSENFVVWGGDVRGAEGFQMTHNMKASTFPYMAVVSGSSGGGLTSRVTMMYQREGEVTAEELMRDLARVIEERGTMLEAAREQEERRAHDRMIREEQDALYMASLREDQERERRRREELERQAREAAEEERRKEEEEEAARLAVQRADEKARLLEQRRKEKQESLGSEPEKGPNVTTVLVRLPNGQRLERRFHSTATVQALYDYVDSVGCLKTENYNLVTSYPRVTYGASLRNKTLLEAGLHPQAGLFVQEES